MNTLIKRSMKLGIVALVISAAIVPACAQKGIKPIKPKAPKPPRAGSAGAVVHTPKIPVVSPTVSRAVATATSTHVPSAVTRAAVSVPLISRPVQPVVTQRLKTVNAFSMNKFDLNEFPNLQNQLLRFMVANRIRIHPDKIQFGLLYRENYAETLPKRLTGADSPLYMFLQWGKTPAGSLEIMLSKPNLMPVQLEPIETFLTVEAVQQYLASPGTQPITHFDNLIEVFEKTDAIFFDKYGEEYFLDPKSAEQFPSYQEVWNEVAQLYAPTSVTKYGWGTNPHSPLQDIFHSRNQTVQRALYDVPVEQRGLTSKYVLIDSTAQRTAEEIQFLLENLPEDNPLRQNIETMLRKNGYIAPTETPAP